MKKTMKILAIAIIAIAAGCSSPGADGSVSVKVQDVEQVEKYTYLLVKGKGPAYWIAVSSTEIAVGEKITYQGGMLMENFYSKELDKTFEKVIFLDGVNGSAPATIEGMPVLLPMIPPKARGVFPIRCPMRITRKPVRNPNGIRSPPAQISAKETAAPDQRRKKSTPRKFRLS